MKFSQRKGACKKGGGLGVINTFKKRKRAALHNTVRGKSFTGSPQKGADRIEGRHKEGVVGR